MNVLDEYEKSLPGVKGSFQDLPITSDVQKELDFWYRTDEEDGKAYPKLKTYWDYIQFGDNWTPKGTPWSSAFISYQLRAFEFPKQGAHRNYIKDIMDGKNPSWAAFSIPKTSKLKLEVGNVLIKPRSGDYNNTHGDVIYKIEDGKAYLVGGNVSNTAKVTKILDVDEKGFVVEPIANYLIILKKKSTMGNIAMVAILGLTALFILPKIMKK